MTEKKKECKSCMQVKPVEAFYVNQYSPDGRYSFCKVCFDLFIKGKEKQAENPLSGFEKRCTKCNQVKLLNEFYERPASLPGKESWCKSCQKKYLKARKQKQKQKSQPLSIDEESLPSKALRQEISEPRKVSKKPPKKEPEGGQNEEALLSIEALLEESPESNAVHQQPADECMFLDMEIEEIQGLLAPQIETALPPKRRVDIMLKERRCNGCNKVEPVIEVTRRVRVPAHAWFCDICKENNTRMYVRRGLVVYDEYGGAYKITKVLNDEVIEGVAEKENGRWDGKKVRVYGNWTTRK